MFGQHMHQPMTHPATDDVQEALRPIASLISKSEKAQKKLTPGTWQHSMLRDNLKALHIASALMTNGIDNKYHWTPGELRGCLQSFASMISRAEKAQARFSLGTSHHTLQRNRLKALRIAETFIKAVRRGLPEEMTS